MEDIKLHQEMHRIDHLFNMVSRIEDEEMKAHWSKYLCIMVSGFIENALKHLISNYAKGNSHPYISKYVNNNIKSITNLNYTKIISLLGSFSDEWREAYEINVSDDEREAIDSVVAIRHSIAHGRSVGLTYVRMLEYYKKIKKVIEVIDNMCMNKETG